MAKKRRLRAKNRMGVVVPYDIAADDVTMGNGKSVESDIAGIKQAIRTLHATLGNYAFPSGKPDINFDGGGGGGSDTQSAEIAYSLGQKVTAQGAGNLINMYDELTVQLGTNDNLYVIDPSTVHVTMGNVEQENVYDEETDTIHIAVVTGDVVIEADAMTYIDDGHLVAMFDGMNRGDVTGEWTDVKDSTRKVAMTNCTEATDHVQFSDSSTSYCEDDIGISVAPDEGTLEAVLSDKSVSNDRVWEYLLMNNQGKSKPRQIVGGIMYSTLFNNAAGIFLSQKVDTSENYSYQLAWLCNTSNFSPAHISMSNARAFLNGAKLTRSQYNTGFLVSANSRLGISGGVNSTTGAPFGKKGKIYCIRVYDRQLSEQEVLQNYNIDRKRFKLS